MPINAGSVYSELVLDASKYSVTMDKAQKQMDEFTSNMQNAGSKLTSFGEQMSKAGEKMSNAGKSLTKYVTLPIAGIGVAASKAGFDFEAQMSRVEAISGATGDAFEKLEKQAMDLGSNTAFSASEAAQGMENLASAGFNTNEIMDAMPGLLDLAASSGADLATASEIAASTLRGFGMAASEAGHVADVLARAAADTNAQIEDMGEAMKYAAPVAKAMGYSIEETAAAIGVMSDAGIKGGMAGTALRGALIRLTKPAKQAKDAMTELGFSAFDVNGKMKPLEQIMGELQIRTKGMSEEQKNAAIAAIFGQEALSGMLALMEAGPDRIKGLTESFKNADGAAKAMAETMMDNTKGSIEEMNGALETAGITISKTLAPMTTKAAEKVTDLANAFSKLNPKTQEAIVKYGLMAAAAGPLLIVSGKMASGIGSIISLFGKFAPAATAATAATGNVAGGIGAAGLAAKLGAALLNPWVLGIGAATIAGVALYKGLQEEVVPSVDLFNNKVIETQTVLDETGNQVAMYTAKTVEFSEATKTAVGAYVKLNDEATDTLTNFFINATTITDQTAKDLITKYSDMGAQIKTGLDTKYSELETRMKEFYKTSSSMTEEEEAKSLESLKVNNEAKKLVVEDYLKQIQEILKKASDEKRALTLEEQETINTIQQKMKEQAIKVLSETELESKVLLERMKGYTERVTAEQAADIVKKANDTRDKAVEAANKQYDGTVAAIIKMRDETGAITKDQADSLIREATFQRDMAITRADEMRKGVVDKLKEMSPDVENEVNLQTGTIMTAWDNLKRWWDNLWFQPKVLEAEIRMPKVRDSSIANRNINAHASGTWDAPGGWSWIGEQGPELMYIKPHSIIRPHDESMRMMQRTATPVQPKVELHMHIGALIADDYGLKQLERKLAGVRIGEDARLGVDKA